MHDGLTRAELIALVDRTRLEKHISVRAAARLCGVPASTMQGWLQGRYFPTPALRPKFLALVDHLGLTEYLHAGLWQDEL
ncbi:MAG: helix-turn-helix transcriptional regulator [Propionicimonas sp.]